MIDDQPTWVSITKSRVKKLLGGQAEEVPSTLGRLAFEESIRALVQQPNPVDILFVDRHLDESLGDLADGEAVVAFVMKEGFQGVTVLQSGDENDGYTGKASPEPQTLTSLTQDPKRRVAPSGRMWELTTLCKLCSRCGTVTSSPSHSTRNR